MIVKSLFVSAIVISVVGISFSQPVSNGFSLKEIKPYSGKSSKTSDLNNFEPGKDSLKENVKVTGLKKSPALAFLYSLLLPGTGQLYTKRLDVGKYFMISEAALWLGFASFTVYGNWLHNDAHTFAQIHAGINASGKDDNFFVNISNYDNVYQYNDDQLRNGRVDQLYDVQNGYYFYWDNVANRKQYRVDQLAGDRVMTDRAFFVGAIIANHLISAISALVLTNSYNSKISGKDGGFMMNADVVRYGSRVDGLQLKLTKWF